MKARVRVLAALVIVAAAFVVYRGALTAYFFDDDFQWLVGTWSFGAARLFDLSQLSHFYRPVIDVYFAAATPLYGGSPAMFHAANIVIHAANGLLLLALARTLSRSDAYAFLAALFFVVQPADVDTIAWISALAEAVAAFFGCLALLAFLRFRQTGVAVWYGLSLAAFLLALVTHESSVVFLALLAVTDWALPRESPRGDSQRGSLGGAIGPYVPFLAIAAAYLVVDIRINSHNYLITEGHYAFGLHVFTNVRDYLVALYVGKGNAANYAFVVCAIAAVLASRNRRVLCAGAWIAVTLAPFVFFTWGTSFRYLYLPAMGFSMLVAEGVLQLDRLLARWMPRAARAAVVAVLVAAMAGRFMVFAAANVRSFAGRTEVYRRYMTNFKRVHGDLAHNSRVVVDAAGRQFAPKFLIAMIQWEYRDPTIELVESTPESH
jgi:hypothetical protein